MLGNGSVLLDGDIEMVYCQDQLPSGNMPATV